MSLLSLELESLGSRSPVYPVFLGICYKVFGKNDNAIRVVQILLSGIVALMVYFFTTRYYGVNVGFIAGLLYSFCPTFGYYPAFFLRETLLVALFFISSFLILKAFDVRSIFVAVCAALSVILTILTKPVFLFLGLFIVLMLMLFCRESIILDRRKAALAAIIVFLPILFLLGPFIKLNEAKPQALTGGGIGTSLIYNSSELALSDKEKVARLIGLVSRNLSEKLFPDIDFRTLWPYPAIAKEIIERAHSKYSQLSNSQDRLLNMVFDLYQKHPFGYLTNRLTTLIRLNAFQYPSRLNETDRWKDFYNRGNSKSFIFIFMDLFLKLVSNPVFWAAGGIIIMKRKKLPVCPVLLPILYVNLVYCFIDGIPRYALPILPFYLIAGSVLFEAIWTKAVSSYRSWPFISKDKYIPKPQNLSAQ